MKKKTSISILVAIMISICFFLAGAVMIFVSYRTFEQRYVSLCNDNLNSYAAMAASYVEIEDVVLYEQSGEMNDGAQRTYDNLLAIRKAVPEVNYLFLYRPIEEGFQYIMDVYSEEDDPENYSALGDIYEFDEWAEANVKPDILAEKASEKIIEQPDMGFGRVLCAWAPVLGADGSMIYMVEADMMIDGVNSYIRNYITQIALIFVICMVLDILVTIWVSKLIITNPLVALTNYVESYENGEFSGETFKNATSDEIYRLSESFTFLNKKINDYVNDIETITKERERIGAELDLAEKIQKSSLPSIFPAFPERSEFDLYATMDPAKEVGGDFYDFFMIDEDHLGLVIADVCGKGVGAALFMMISKTLINNQAMFTESPEEVLRLVNSKLCENNEAEMFVTVWLGILNLKTGVLSAANAGHEYPVICRAGGEFELLKDRHGFVMGAMPGVKYKEYQIEFQKGDMIYVYTDGVPEATNTASELFGTERMLTSLNRRKDSSLEDMMQGVREDISKFAQGAQQFDDITMLVMKYNG